MISTKIGFAAVALFGGVAFSTSACAAPGKVTFEQGKMIEAAFFKIKPGSEKRVKEEYFAKVIPIAQEYGLKPLASFAVKDVDHGPSGEIGAWGFFEWPSMAKKAAFEKDPRFVELRKFRDSLLSTLPKQVYLEVDKSVSFEIDKKSMYEAAVLWVNASKSKHLRTYFRAAGPFVEKRNVKVIGDFKVIGQPDADRYRFDSLPSSFVFIEWPSKSVKQEWFDSKAFAKHGHHRALALDRLFVIESSAN